MLAEFEIIGRVARVTDLSNKRESNATHLVSVASTKSWQHEQSREWQEKTFFHTLTVYAGLSNVVRGLDVGDLVRFIGDIESWQTQDGDTQEWRSGTTLVVKHRRILTRKRQQGGEEASDLSTPSGPDHSARADHLKNGKSKTQSQHAR